VWDTTKAVTFHPASVQEWRLCGVLVGCPRTLNIQMVLLLVYHRYQVQGQMVFKPPTINVHNFTYDRYNFLGPLRGIHSIALPSVLLYGFRANQM